MDLQELLRLAVTRGASDLHLRAGCRPRVRVDGRLEQADPEPWTAEETDRVAQMVMPPDRAREFAATSEADFAYEAAGVGRFRVNVFREQGTTALVLRRVLPSIASIEALGLPPVVRQLADEPNGLVLVTGRVGSGKTTTLAAIIEEINETREAHILTIEDPVEITHANKRSIVSQREVGSDTEDFRAALKRVLRQDPDVILIGEMRDAETVWAAISAAETGHLVLSSLHTVDVTETINRILDFFPAHQHAQVRSSLAAALRGIVSQRLLPRADGAGRIPAVEVLVATGRVFDRIVSADKTHELKSIMADGSYYGMQTFDRSLLDLYERGMITRRDAIGAATHPHDLRLEIEKLEAAASREVRVGVSSPV